ncbi:hypothetical protein C8R46DRAFT_1218543 [Mycena filopes]|nr:hypothetical protein C8R46DRAFT_1218543 [Mycena filopes]
MSPDTLARVDLSPRAMVLFHTRRRLFLRDDALFHARRRPTPSSFSGANAEASALLVLLLHASSHGARRPYSSCDGLIPYATASSSCVTTPCFMHILLPHVSRYLGARRSQSSRDGPIPYATASFPA